MPKNILKLPAFLIVMSIMAFFAVSLIALQGCSAKTGLDTNSLQHTFPTPHSSAQPSQPSPAASPSKKGDDPQGELSAPLYFANSTKDPDVQNPEVTYPVNVTVKAGKDEDVARNILDELLKGPSPDHKSKGYYTALPPKAKVNFLKFEKGTIHVDFDNAINKGGGSCDMEQRRSQIENTLRNIPGHEVKKVIISVNGDSQNVMQP
jgi:spore germination protein GerM